MIAGSVAALSLAWLTPSPANLQVTLVQATSGYPEMQISKAGSVHEWPFAVDTGDLTCVAMGGQKVVIFSEPWRKDVVQEFGNMTLPRSVIVSANPLALLASLEDRALYAPFDTLETLIKRLAPFERMGWDLCDSATEQPQTGQN